MKKLLSLIAVIAVTALVWYKENNPEFHFALSLAALATVVYLIRPLFSIRIKRNRAGE
ncbi:hypothetical protein SAMN06265348_10993 [Pedobacter westerhofensis]|uniref:Uncharacterized protein n=1 Tax=Pedobacter westerhofensis TaxID=425512 RepID=A0A521ESN4_9SPHI|nr:hypothetical protein [Pedobacter westerhofensis]SMO86956.1 hypothetical protein SAMN06265348_10993 [Pedobacter westerhofensis]